MSPLVIRVIGAVLILAGVSLIAAHRRLGAWALKTRGEQPTQEGEPRGYGAAFMVAGDVLIAVGVILVLGLFPAP